MAGLSSAPCPLRASSGKIMRPGHEHILIIARSTALGSAVPKSRPIFPSRQTKGETPVGARTYTHVSFQYTDPTNGTYCFEWSWPGAHDPSFLRFDQRFRLYQVVLIDDADAQPPRLYIEGIQGIRPQF